MKLILAGMATVITALVWNKLLFLLKLSEKLRVGILIPLGEESIKLLTAFFLEISPFQVSMVFGLGEGLFETVHLKKHFNLKIIIAGLIIHIGFGVVYLFKIPVWISFIWAVLLHVFWNCYIEFQNN